jgi:NADH-quinone oxidoreductase subunit J
MSWIGGHLVEIVFWGFGGFAVVAAALCITRRSPLASALWLIQTLFCLAVLFTVLDAAFIGILQVLVYAGAIMVLFLFVIMLLNLGRGGPGDVRGLFGAAVSAVLGAALLFQLKGLGQAGPPDAIRLPPGSVAAAQQHQGVVNVVAAPLFDTYLIPFEITSLLLLAAVVGAVVLAKRKL